MKKDKRRGFISGVIATVLVFALSITCFAAAKTIQVNSGIKLKIDGAAFVPKDVNGKEVEVFEYNGTTYVPIRAISQAFGKEVAWDGATRTAIIGNNESSGSYNRQNPAPVGKAQTVNISNILEKYTATVSITEVLRGDEAWVKIKDANMFNSPAADGKEYILAKVKASVSNVQDDKAISFYTGSLTAYSANNVEYPMAYEVVEPEPVFDGKVFNGGTLEGYIIFAVDKSDKAPKAVFGAAYDGSGGIWFSLSK